MIVSDVPAGQRPELGAIHLVAPTSTDERIRLAAASTTDGWLYLVTLTGTTGARTELSSALEGLVGPDAPAGGRRAALRGLRHLDTRAGAAAAASLADGVVVGSRAVQVAEDGPAALAGVRRRRCGGRSTPSCRTSGTSSRARERCQVPITVKWPRQTRLEEACAPHAGRQERHGRRLRRVDPAARGAIGSKSALLPLDRDRVPGTDFEARTACAPAALNPRHLFYPW